MINYNATPHSVTGHAPQELRYGVIEGRQTMSEAELVEARAAAAEKTRRQREYEQDRRKKRIQEDKIEVGDQVLLYIKDRGNRDKMSMSWESGYVVVDIPYSNHFKIKEASGRIKLVHGDQIKRLKTL